MEFSDSPFMQSLIRARAAFADDAGLHLLNTCREINAASWRLARLNTEAGFYVAHALLHSTDPLHAFTILMKQVHPAVERSRAWQERVLDLLGGAQAELAATAEAYVPAVRNAAAAIPD